MELATEDISMVRASPTVSSITASIFTAASICPAAFRAASPVAPKTLLLLVIAKTASHWRALLRRRAATLYFPAIPLSLPQLIELVLNPTALGSPPNVGENVEAILSADDARNRQR